MHRTVKISKLATKIKNMGYDKERIMELYSEESTITDVAKKYAKENGIEYTDSIRRSISKVINKNDDDDLDNNTKTETNQYSNISPLSALKEDGSIMDIEEYCNFYNIPYEQVKTFKLVTHTGKGAYYNIASNTMSGKGFEEFYRQLLEDLASISNKPKSVNRKTEVGEHLLVIDPADVHIGKLSDSFETGEDYDSQIAV